jgi:hypothetical protein
MNLGKNFIVRKNEKVSNYDASKQVAMMPLRPLRTTVISFSAPPGKYAIIPLVDRSMDSRYTLKLYFGQDSTEIKLHTQDTAPFTPILDVTPVKKTRPGTASSKPTNQF